MNKRQDFQKLSLISNGKKNTKIFKAQHLTSGKIYAIKEIEADSLNKLNEYKEEAVQLSKLQNHPNLIKFFGYYFSQSKYNYYRIGLITEFMEQNQNLELIYRQKEMKKQHWKESELMTILFSLISTFSFLQQRGICHRDIKPSNLFLMQNGEIKLIDFGESKDYFFDPNDDQKNTYTVATIRGTPQYLSPQLWKSHMIDQKGRFVEHNIYKSDVFSSGLVIFQLALLQEVSGFNNNITGEQNIKNHLIKLEKIYSPQLVNIIALMLIFEESNRPSFVEIEQLFIEHETQADEQEANKLQNDKNKKKINEYIKLYNQQYNTLLNKGSVQKINDFQNINQNNNKVFNNSQNQSNSNKISVNSNNQASNTTNLETQSQSHSQYDSNLQNQKILQQGKFQNQQIKEQQAQFYKETTLIQHESCYWFEFGGSSIGKFSIHKQRWKVIQSPDKTIFPEHFVTIYIPDQKACFLLGGNQGSNFRIFKNGKIQNNLAQNPTYRNFFPAVYFNQKIFVFGKFQYSIYKNLKGGYDRNTKQQLKSCELYDIQQDKWSLISEMNLHKSQAASCKINDNEILIFGGYNKESGTLDSIEKFIISENKWEILKCKLPIQLRRFVVVKVAKNIALILGGLTKLSKESQKVFKFDYIKQEFSELENLEKGGIIESEVLVDNNDYLHIFLEHANGTSPHSHIKYYYDPRAGQYITKQE